MERIATSQFKNNLVIKGGVLVSALVGVAARSTMDIDITIKQIGLGLDDVSEAVKKIASIDLNDNVAFQFIKAENIRDESDYECFRMSLDVNFDRVRDNIKLDISRGDVITPKEIAFHFETMLDKRKIELMTYNIETVLAEKIETILSRSVLNTRMRDFYDCFIINKTIRSTVDKSIFIKALMRTTAKRGTEHIFEKRIDAIKEISLSADLLKLWSNYVKTYPYAKGIAFEEVIAAVKAFLEMLET